MFAGNASPFTTRGTDGRLLSGCRQVARLMGWEGSALPGVRRLRVTATSIVRDPVWWSHHTKPLTAELTVGRQRWRGSVALQSSDPLVFVLEGFDVN